MEEELEKLKKRVEELEKRPQYVQYPPIYVQPHYPPYAPFHYHGLMPCYNNPCVWNGNFIK